jgi:hypothetical protein
MNVFALREIDDRIQQLQSVKETLVANLQQLSVHADALPQLRALSAEPFDEAIAKLRALRRLFEGVARVS